MPAAVIIVVIDAVEVFDGAVARFAEDAVVLGAEVPTRGRLLGVSRIVERPGMEIGVGGGDVEVEADEKHVAMVALMEMGSSILLWTGKILLIFAAVRNRGGTSSRSKPRSAWSHVRPISSRLACLPSTAHQILVELRLGKATHAPRRRSRASG